MFFSIENKFAKLLSDSKLKKPAKNRFEKYYMPVS